MRILLVIFVVQFLIGCGSYQGAEIWRRSTCNDIADAYDREQCIEQATRSENEYKQDVKEATTN